MPPPIFCSPLIRPPKGPLALPLLNKPSTNGSNLSRHKHVPLGHRKARQDWTTGERRRMRWA